VTKSFHDLSWLYTFSSKVYGEHNTCQKSPAIGNKAMECTASNVENTSFQTYTYIATQADSTVAELLPKLVTQSHTLFSSQNQPIPVLGKILSER